MITINGKTYRQKHNKYGIDWLIEHGYLEEVKENKEPTVHIPNDGKKYMINGELYNPQANSILEKLREELDKMKTENTDTSDEYTQGVLNTCGYLLDLLTSLETKKCDHVSDGVVYTSNPPQYKCSKCGVYSTEFMPIETKEEPQPQEDIELLPFKFQYANEWSSGTTLSQIGKHLELLTNAVNKLIKANKK